MDQATIFKGGKRIKRQNTGGTQSNQFKGIGSRARGQPITQPFTKRDNPQPQKQVDSNEKVVRFEATPIGALGRPDTVIPPKEPLTSFRMEPLIPQNFNEFNKADLRIRRIKKIQELWVLASMNDNRRAMKLYENQIKALNLIK